MIIVTGGLGFIGSNIIASLNDLGIEDILVVDDFTDGKRLKNIQNLNFKDYMDKFDFLKLLKKGRDIDKVSQVFHQGACSATTEWDGQYLMKNNFEYSKLLYHWCVNRKIPFIYASSASVYGLGLNGFKEKRTSEMPINMYAFSKFQFDQYVRRTNQNHSQVVGLRYFNVYGPREDFKGNMASTIYHFNNQAMQQNTCNLFEGIDGILDGEQQRDFIHVNDCVSVNLWFLENNISGIFNVGTGVPRTFNDVARCVQNWYSEHKDTQVSIKYIEFPQHLVGSYQNFTQADLSNLRSVGYDHDFLTLEEGISDYLCFQNGN
jgi:ADP-L-glycero-D-manno-heptose 6-epimerase